MDKNKFLARQRQRRKTRVRKRVFGSPERPRLTVFRSLRNVYAQIVDDVAAHTLASADSLSLARAGTISAADAGNVKGAAEVGKALATLAKEAGVVRVVFDRNGYKYHGRIKALADGARAAGLEL